MIYFVYILFIVVYILKSYRLILKTYIFIIKTFSNKIIKYFKKMDPNEKSCEKAFQKYELKM